MKMFVKRNLKKIISISVAVVILASVCIAGTMSSNASGTGAGLAEWALNAYNSHWRYVYGGASPGAVDCSGLIYSYCGGARTNLEVYATEIGYVSSGVPRVHGLGLHQPGHYGVYVGDGMAVDARGDAYGVCYESIATKSWVEWFKVSACNYITNGWEQFNGRYYYYENGEYVVSTSRVIGGITYNFNGSGASDKTPADMNAVANNSGGASSSTKKSSTNSGSTSSSGTSSSASTKSSTLKNGSSGNSVTKLQNRLTELGFYNGEVTGYFGEMTEAAYKKFQKAAGLSADGIAGKDEHAILYSDNAPSAAAEDTDKSEKEEKEDKKKTEENKPEGTYSVGDEGDEITAIQQQLTDLGYYSGEITGYFGELTEQAVMNFQTVNELEVTGIVDKETYDLMFSQEDTSEDETEETTTGEETEEITTEAADTEEYVEETEPVTYETPEASQTPAKVVKPAETKSIAASNFAVAQKVVMKTNRFSKNALKSYSKDNKADIAAGSANNARFLIWLIVVIALAAAVTGTMLILNRRKAAYSGARVREKKKQPETHVRYW